MSHPETIKIDNVEYVRKDSVISSDSPIKIVILQRGWVVVGRFSQEGHNCKLDNAAVIRKWGTTKGLPEIALDGPTKNTVLDKLLSMPIRFHELTVIAMIDCEASKWIAHL
jgi:hypothetical protein